MIAEEDLPEIYRGEKKAFFSGARIGAFVTLLICAAVLHWISGTQLAYGVAAIAGLWLFQRAFS